MKQNELDVLPFMKNRKPTEHFDASEVYRPQRQPQREPKRHDDDVPLTWFGLLAEFATVAGVMGMLFVFCYLLWFIS